MIPIDDQEVIPSLSQSILTDGFDMVLDLDKSRGARLHDAKRNRTVIDFFSFFASNPIGLNHPRLFEEEFEARLLKFARVKVSNADMYTTAYAEFVASFHRHVTPMFDRLFFIEGGALGVENAIKTAQDWKVQKNLASGRGEIGTQVLHFNEAFHGRSGYTLSLTNPAPAKVRYFAKFDWPRVINPKLKYPLTAESLRETLALEELASEQIHAAFATRPHQICSILIEPIQGEGGDNFFRAEFLRKLRELADAHDALLRFDEVQTGMGTTGRFWAFEHFGVQPDLIAFGKKVQVCGCAARLERLSEVEHTFKVSSRINSTFGGNLADMVRTTQIIDIILQENLLEHAARTGETLKRWLLSLAESDERVTNVRGLGLWLAFDLPTATLRDQFVKLCWQNGLIILPSGKRTIRIRTVLDLKLEDAADGFTIIHKSLGQLKSGSPESFPGAIMHEYESAAGQPSEDRARQLSASPA